MAFNVKKDIEERAEHHAAMKGESWAVENRNKRLDKSAKKESMAKKMKKDSWLEHSEANLKSKFHK